MRIKSVFSSRMEFFFSKENIPKSNDPILSLIVWIIVFWIFGSCLHAQCTDLIKNQA